MILRRRLRAISEPLSGMSRRKLLRMYSIHRENDGSLCFYRTASACRKSAADLCAQVEDYRGAIQLYEMVANYALKSNLTKYSVKDYWLRSGLCALAMRVCFSLMWPSHMLIILQDVGKAQRDIEVFKSKDITFSSTRECKFLEDICACVTEGDEQGFTSAAFEYDQVTKLDEWKASILMKIKRTLKDEVDIL